MLFAADRGKQTECESGCQNQAGYEARDSAVDAHFCTNRQHSDLGGKEREECVKAPNREEHTESARDNA